MRVTLRGGGGFPPTHSTRTPPFVMHPRTYKYIPTTRLTPIYIYIYTIRHLHVMLFNATPMPQCSRRFTLHSASHSYTRTYSACAYTGTHILAQTACIPSHPHIVLLYLLPILLPPFPLQHGSSPLPVAIKNGHQMVVRVLLDAAECYLKVCV